jgi:hypothetical protein
MRTWRGAQFITYRDKFAFFFFAYFLRNLRIKKYVNKEGKEKKIGREIHNKN